MPGLNFEIFQVPHFLRSEVFQKLMWQLLYLVSDDNEPVLFQLCQRETMLTGKKKSQNIYYELKVLEALLLHLKKSSNIRTSFYPSL